MKKKPLIEEYVCRIPSWAMCYLINSDDSSLDENDKAEVDAWVDRIRQGGRIDVCPPDEMDAAYFSSHPAFGLATEVEDCTVIVSHVPRYEQCRYRCLGQSRYEPIQRQSIDSRWWWWCVYDHGQHRWMPGKRFRTRRECVLDMMMDFRHERFPYEPDNDLRGLEWLKGVSSLEEAMKG